MRLFLWICLSVIALAQEPGSILSVEIKVMPAQGSAFCRYTPDGKTHGGHASPPPVRVYEDDGTIEPAVVTRIWSLAADLQKRGIARVASETPARGQNFILLHLQDGSTLAVSWPEREPPADPAARELADLLFTNRVGGW